MRNPVLVGTCVYVRPVEVADAESHARWRATETDTFMHRGRRPFSVIGMADENRRAYTAQPPSFVGLSVCLITNDLHIGEVGIGDFDWVNRTGETSSFFGPNYRNQGYGTEAKHLLLAYCFDRLQLHAIRSRVLETNPRSAAALAKQGYRLAGRTRWHDVKDGVYVDALIFSVTRADWLVARDVWRAGRGT